MFNAIGIILHKTFSIVSSHRLLRKEGDIAQTLGIDKTTILDVLKKKDAPVVLYNAHNRSVKANNRRQKHCEISQENPRNDSQWYRQQLSQSRSEGMIGNPPFEQDFVSRNTTRCSDLQTWCLNCKKENQPATKY